MQQLTKHIVPSKQLRNVHTESRNPLRAMRKNATQQCARPVASVAPAYSYWQVLRLSKECIWQFSVWSLDEANRQPHRPFNNSKPTCFCARIALFISKPKPMRKIKASEKHSKTGKLGQGSAQVSSTQSSSSTPEGRKRRAGSGAGLSLIPRPLHPRIQFNYIKLTI